MHCKTFLFIAHILFLTISLNVTAADLVAEIEEVLLNYEAGQITIAGTGLHDGESLPIVTLGGVDLLDVIIVDEHTIQGDIDLLGQFTISGDYQLIIDPNYETAMTAQTLLTLSGAGAYNPNEERDANDMAELADPEFETQPGEVTHRWLDGSVPDDSVVNLDIPYMLNTAAGDLDASLNANGTTDYGFKAVSNGLSGRGVYGIATATTGNTYGVIGLSESTDGRGVYGIASATTGFTRGVYGASVSTSGRGVYGYASATTGTNFGVYGRSVSTTGRGVYGYASASTGTTYGVIGWSSSFSGYDFFAAGWGINYGSTSSRRWKSNIRSIDDPLGKVARLRGVYFDWDAEHGGKHDVGFIAEEVGEVIPEIVQYEENGIDATGLDYSMVTPLLVEALNALRVEKDAQIDELRVEKDAQIDELRTRLEQLEAKLLQD